MQNTQRPGTHKKLKPRLAGANSPLPQQCERCQILAKKGFLTARNVTSGIALLVYSREFQLGVLLHLPPMHGNHASQVTSDDRAFAQSAMAMILTEFQALGVRKRELLTYAIGGSESEGSVEASELSVRSALWSHGLTLSASDLGGDQVRSIWMDVETGRTIVRSESALHTADSALAPLRAAS